MSAPPPRLRPDRPVGRDAVLARLDAALAATAAGSGCFVLLTGPAGIGKTTMLTAAATRAAAYGVRPAWGFCHPGDGVPAFSAWRQVTRALEIGWPDPGTGDDARFALFDEVAAALLAESRTQPVAVLLDDVQWADEGSRRLLDLLVRRLPSGALSVVAARRGTIGDLGLGTVRNLGPGTVGDRGHGTVGDFGHGTVGDFGRVTVGDLGRRTAGDRGRGTVGDLGRAEAGDPGRPEAGDPGRPEAGDPGRPEVGDPGRPEVGDLGRAEVVPLPELSPDDVAELVGDPGRAASVYRRAGGNPFLVRQVMAGGTAGVRDALADRFAAIPPDVVAFLGRAAAWGRSFIAADVSGPLDPGAAVDAGVLRRDGVGRYSFAHDLFREWVYAELPADARRAAHAHAAGVLATRPGTPAAELAGHLLAAAPVTATGRDPAGHPPAGPVTATGDGLSGHPQAAAPPTATGRDPADHPPAAPMTTIGRDPAGHPPAGPVTATGDGLAGHPQAAAPPTATGRDPADHPPAAPMTTIGREPAGYPLAAPPMTATGRDPADHPTAGPVTATDDGLAGHPQAAAPPTATGRDPADHPVAAGPVTAAGRDPAETARPATADQVPVLYAACAAAAREAAGALAFEQAAEWWARTADAAATSEQRVDATIGLGDAQRAAGDGRDARTAYDRAAAASRVTPGYPAGLALAALGRHALGTRVFHSPDELLDALGEAADACAGAADRRTRLLGLRARASLAATLAWHERDPDRAAALAAAAAAGARDEDDPATVAHCLVAVHHARRAPGTAADRAGLAAEIERVAYPVDAGLAAEAVLLRAGDLLEAGDPAFRDVLAEFVARADRPHLRYAALVRRAMLAQLEGRFDEADRLAAEALALGEACAEEGADDVWRDQFWQRAVDTGRSARPSGAEASPQYRGLRAIALLAEGAVGQAAELAAPLLASDPAVVTDPRRRGTLPELPYVTELAVPFAEPERQRALYRSLRPYAGECAVSGVAVSFRGSVAHHLGRLAAAAGDLGEAAELLDAAVGAHVRLGAVPWWLRSRYERAVLAVGDGDPVAELRDVAARAAALGMARLARDATAAADAATPGHPPDASPGRGPDAAAGRPPHAAAGYPPGAAAARPPHVVGSYLPEATPGRPPDVGAGYPPEATAAGGSLVREGSSWTVDFAGQRARIRHSKGLGDLATLLAAPGRDLAAIDLAAAPDPSGTARAVLALGADEILDATARRRLTERIAALDAVAAEGDAATAARARAERAELFDALGAATGLGGRSRRLGDAAERARKAVSARIGDAIARVGAVHPALGAHLAASVTTGSRCAYRPDPPVAWRVRA